METSEKRKLDTQDTSLSECFDSLKEKHNDDFVITVIRGLNLFIAQATSAGCGTVARILHGAKEEIVFWAVNMGFHETLEEKFINQHLYNNDLFAASDFIVKFAASLDRKTRDKILQDIEKVEDVSVALVKALRELA